MVHLSALLLRKLTPPFGKLVAEEQRLEGEFRFTHSRFIENAEEVAFYRGEAVEKGVVNDRYRSLRKHIESIFKQRVWHGMLEDFIVKYLWSAGGLFLCSVPIFFPHLNSASSDGSSLSSSGKSSDVTEGFVTNRRLLLSSSDAVGRVMYSYKEINELLGYTQRVYELLEVIEDISRGKCVKNMVSGADHQLLQQRGIVEKSEDVEFVDVPIVSPNGDVLLRALSFYVHKGMHLLIVGPNGCGSKFLLLCFD